LTMFFAFGLCFEVPVGVFIIALMGWVTPEQLAKHRPYVILGAFVVAAIVAPPDVLSMIMLAIPMCLLYEAGLLAVRIFLRRSTANARE
jgi:sec-independent protein translocase protein TatC